MKLPTFRLFRKQSDVADGHDKRSKASQSDSLFRHTRNAMQGATYHSPEQQSREAHNAVESEQHVRRGVTSMPSGQSQFPNKKSQSHVPSKPAAADDSNSESFAAYRETVQRRNRSMSKIRAFSRMTPWQVITNPVWCYYGLITIVGMLCMFGLIMVFSSSTVVLISNDRSPYYQVIMQTAFMVTGVIIAVILSRLRNSLYYQWTFRVFLVVLILQVIASQFGASVGGNKGWIRLGPIGVQPAEILKLSLILVLARLLSYLTTEENEKAVVLFSFLSLGFAFGAVILGSDLGSALVLCMIAFGMVFIAGVRLRWFMSLGALGSVLVLVLVLTSSNRVGRILSVYNCISQGLESRFCYQTIHGFYAVASGGLYGVGLGASREKWNYLPASFNDFIYAVICEELGFIGAISVIIMFIIFAWCITVIALHHTSPFARLVMFGIEIWIVGQALVNIAVVLGVLPVVGLPLPFISAGGTSMIMCLAAIGIVLNFARQQRDIATIVRSKA